MGKVRRSLTRYNFTSEEAEQLASGMDIDLTSEASDTELEELADIIGRLMSKFRLALFNQGFTNPIHVLKVLAKSFVMKG